MSKGSVIFVTNAFFPYGQAYSQRALNLSRIFRACGYTVRIIADCTKEKIEGKGLFDGFEYYVAGDNSKGGRYFYNKRNSLKILEELIDGGDVQAVLISGGTYDRFDSVRDICTRKGIPLILEICEWYDIASFKLGKLDFRYNRFNTCINKSFFHADAFIVISRLLEEHFKESGKPIIRIPTVIDSNEFAYSEETGNKKIKLIHAGTAVGKQHKELFRDIMLALSEYGDNSPFEYTIFGSDRQTVLENIGNDSRLLDSLYDTVKIAGKVPQKEMLQRYCEADFSIFVRPDRRSSHAGFPTKLAESMAAGTPVIANNTGDIGLYLQDGINGFLLKDGTQQSVKEVLDRIVEHREEFSAMRKNARQTVQKHFNYTEYKGILVSFLEEMRL